MPLFDYLCEDCEHKQEHFVFASDVEKKCPKCQSSSYNKQLSNFRMEVRYSDPKESYNNIIAPHVKDTYKKIGKEALNDDTKTLDNIFGTKKVKDALND